MEKIEERYIRWVFGLDRRTSGYMIKEEIQRGKLKERAGKRAWGFEKRLEEGKGSKLARLCCEEMRGKAGEGKIGSNWEEERRKFFVDRGWEIRVMEKKKEEGEAWFGEIIKKDREDQKKGEGVPEYLRNGWGESRWRRVMRFRLGNEIREDFYWEKDENKVYRMCRGEMETWEHVWEGCRNWNIERESWQEAVKWVLVERGEGEWWMREVERERQGIEEGQEKVRREEESREREEDDEEGGVKGVVMRARRGGGEGRRERE